nr:hydrolase tropi [Quercus suber]
MRPQLVLDRVAEKTHQEITKFDDIEVYVAKPADYPHSPSKLLLLLTGGTGIHSTNNQLQADQYAAEGFLVVMPDQYVPLSIQSIWSVLTSDQIKLGLASVAKLFTIDMWLAYHTPEKVLPILTRVIASAKEEFGDAVANGEGIYAVGYCFGAKYALLLGSAGTDSETTTTTASEAEQGLAKPTGPLIKVATIAHGTQITEDDFGKVKVPTLVVAVEDDPLFPDHVRDGGKKIMEANSLEHELKIYPGVPHGFAVLGDYEDTTIIEKQKEAFEQMLSWLKAH